MVINDVCAVVMNGGPGHPPEKPIYYGLKDSVATYHLVDTSLTSPIRTEGYIEDNKRLNSNGSNLAAVLYRYKRTKEKVYRRIRSTVRKIVPSLRRFRSGTQGVESPEHPLELEAAWAGLLVRPPPVLGRGLAGDCTHYASSSSPRTNCPT